MKHLLASVVRWFGDKFLETFRLQVNKTLGVVVLDQRATYSLLVEQVLGGPEMLLKLFRKLDLVNHKQDVLLHRQRLLDAKIEAIMKTLNTKADPERVNEVTDELKKSEDALRQVIQAVEKATSE